MRLMVMRFLFLKAIKKYNFQPALCQEVSGKLEFRLLGFQDILPAL